MNTNANCLAQPIWRVKVDDCGLPISRMDVNMCDQGLSSQYAFGPRDIQKYPMAKGSKEGPQARNFRFHSMSIWYTPWLTMCYQISGAARSVSRDIPFVSAPFAQEKDTAVPALQQQHATAVIWCRCHSTKTGQNKEPSFVVLIYASASKFDIGEGTTRATCVHHQQPQRQQQQQEGEEKASKCKNSRKWTPSTQNSHVRLTFK